MTDAKSPEEDDERPKKFRITRKRLGKVRFVDSGGEYGFIEAEDFREDVFFHHTSWEPPADAKPPRHQQGPAKLNPELVDRTVEFELDDEVFEQDQKLRAKVVRPSRRPMGRKLSGRDATFKIVTHHPKARRKRPDWRK